MSKKILKRSLALGALMAFVITGSAMAADIAINTNNFGNLNPDVTNTDNLVIGGGDYAGSYWVRGDKGVHTVSGYAKIDYEGTEYPVVGDNSMDSVFVSYANDGSNKVTTLNIHEVGSIVTENNKNKQAVFFNAFGGKIDIRNVDTISVKDAGWVFVARDFGGDSSIVVDEVGEIIVEGGRAVWTNGENADISLTAGNIRFNTTNSRGISTYYGDVDIKAKENLVLELNSGYIDSYAYATVDLEGKNITIVGNGEKVLSSSYGSVLNIGKNDDFVKADITGNIEAIYGGSVDIDLGQGGTLTGCVVTYDAEDVYGSNNVSINFGTGSTWNVTDASTVSNVTFGAGSVLNIGDGSDYEAAFDADGKALTEGTYAITAVGTETSLTIANGAKLQIDGIKETTYNIAKGFEKYDVADSLEIVGNALMEANKKISDNYYQVEVVTKEAEQMATEMGVSNSTAQSVANVTAAAQAAIDGGVVANPEGTGNDKAVALVQAMANANPQAAGQAFEAVSKMAEAGGNSGTAASIVKNVTGVTNDRLSFNCGHSAPHKGGHGVGLFEEGSGADVWVEYVHGKDKVEDMPSSAGATSYEGQYNGIVMGVDFKKVNKFQSGFAFNYGEGDTNSVGSAARTHSDYDFWGIGYYGSIHNDDSNVIFDIGYAKTDSDVETKALGMTYNASPETTTWTAGVKVEKLYQNENVQIVPYTGLRFMSIDPEDYSTECASSKYQMERQNVWLLPLGVSIKQEVTNDNGWTVSPRVDLSYIWAFGDTDSEMEFSTLGTKTNIGYEVMDDGSFLGLVGIEAHKGQWGFGVSYSYQKGDHSESKKWFIDANYSF